MDVQHFSPANVSEAARFLAEHPGEAHVVAGATDLLMDVRMRGRTPHYLVDINGLAELRSIREEADVLAVGALTRMTDLEASEIVRRRYSALADAAAQVGSPQIRNMATVGGNLAHATPSAETAPPLLAFDAVAVLAGPGGTRSVALSEFFTGPGSSVRTPDEILTEIRIPAAPSGSAYLRQCTRGALDIATVGTACAVTLVDGVITDARVALGAVAPTPIRVETAERALVGRRPDDDVLREASRLAAEAAKPITDVRASAAYRKAMVEVLTLRALRVALERAAS